MQEINYSAFKIYFGHEMKRLGLNRGDICKLLKMSRPTLNSRLLEPSTLQVKEIKTLKEKGFILPLELLEN